MTHKPVLIVTPLPEEREAVISLLPELDEQRLESGSILEVTRVTTSGGSIQVGVLMIGEMGNVAAGTSTLEAMTLLRPSVVIVVGVAGGVRGTVELGDVIIADKILYLEKGKITKQGVLSELAAIKCDATLVREAKLLASTPGQLDSSENIQANLRFGALVSVEKVVASSEFMSSLITQHRKLIGVEMESYGVALATEYLQPRPRFIAIRGVSDFADEGKDDSVREVACSNAARVAVTLVTNRIGSSNWNGSGAGREILSIRHSSIAPVSADAVTQSLSPAGTHKDFHLDYSAYPLQELEGIQAALIGQENVASVYDDFKGSRARGSVCYFGLAHIPLAFDLGYRLTNKRPSRLFEFNRYGVASDRWVELTPGDSQVRLETSGMPEGTRLDAGDVALRLSISAVIHGNQIEEFTRDCLESVHLRLTEPRRDSVNSITEVAFIGKEFRECIDGIYSRLPHLRNLHLFYAGPCSLAMYLGQLLMGSTDSRIICYNFTAGLRTPYNWGLRLTRIVDPKDRIVAIDL